MGFVFIFCGQSILYLVALARWLCKGIQKLNIFCASLHLLKLITSEIVALLNSFFFFSKCSKFYLDFKNAIKNNLVVRIFPVVVAAVINLYLGENIRPSQSTCQVKLIELHFFQFYIQGFQYFCIKWEKSFIKKANKISAISMIFETPNDRSSFLFFMLKCVRVDNFVNKF